jgi:branched-chain amino acid transport system ATP-binding protein
VLSVSNLEVVYHSVVLVLKGVSLSVREGEITALLGPNGAGKTTVLRAITGLLDVHRGKQTKGAIVFGDTDLRRMRADAIVGAGIAQVMEGRRILADLTVEENLVAGGHTRTRSEVATDLVRFYERFPVLADRRRQQAGYLSGGEQQMLAIARALMSRPRLLVLDEPSLGLAPKAVAEIDALIRALNAEGMSILLVEQNANLALELADRGTIMENGKVVLEGTPDQLRADEDIQEFYLGLGGGERRSFRDVKLYRRRKRWLS